MRGNKEFSSYAHALEIYRMVQNYRKNHPGATQEQVSKALGNNGKKKGYSRTNIAKFWRREDMPLPKRKHNYFEISSGDLVTSKFGIATVSDQDRRILNNIWELYLRDTDMDTWFECDLTFSRGDFYRVGIPYPKFCFDLFPEQPNDLIDAPEVMPLKDDMNPDNPKAAENILKDNTISSIVIDLPQKIVNGEESSIDSFKSMQDLAISYYQMIDLAYRKLKSTTDLQRGGLLIIKVGDIDYRGKRIWLSNLITTLCTGNESGLYDPITEELEKLALKEGKTREEKYPRFDFDLVDKFIHIFNSKDLNSHNKFSKKSHDYFLVFSKEIKKEPKYLYFLSEYDNLLNKLDGTLLWKNGYYTISTDINKLKRTIPQNIEYFTYRVIISDKIPIKCISTDKAINPNIRRELCKKRIIPAEMFENGNKLLKFLDGKIHSSLFENNISIVELKEKKDKLSDEIKELEKKIARHKERKDKEWIRIDSSELKNKKRELRQLEKQLSSIKSFTDKEKKLKEERLKKKEQSIISSISLETAIILTASGVDYIEIVKDGSNSRTILVLNNSKIDLELIESEEETFYHGSGVLFDKFNLEHALEGDGKVKFGYGVYITSEYSSAAHYSAANDNWDKHYVYTVKVPAKKEDNFIAFKKPVNSTIIKKAEEKLGIEIPECAISDGKNFRKFLVKILSKNISVNSLNRVDLKKTKNLLGEKAASQFLSSIGVDFIEWPFSWNEKEDRTNRVILNDSKIKIIKIDEVKLDNRKILINGSERKIK